MTLRDDALKVEMEVERVAHVLSRRSLKPRHPLCNPDDVSPCRRGCRLQPTPEAQSRRPRRAASTLTATLRAQTLGKCLGPLPWRPMSSSTSPIVRGHEDEATPARGRPASNRARPRVHNGYNTAPKHPHEGTSEAVTDGPRFGLFTGFRLNHALRPATLGKIACRMTRSSSLASDSRIQQGTSRCA